MRLSAIANLIRKHHRSGADGFGGGLLGAVIGGSVGGGTAVVTGAMIGYLAATGYYYFLDNRNE